MSPLLPQPSSSAPHRDSYVKSDAPFLRAKDNSPYLEIHHWITLAEGGDDTIENACALCPNCHRELHFGQQKDQ